MSTPTVTSTNPLTAAREAITEAARAAGWNVYPAPPEVATLPMLVVSPGDPWAAPVTWSRTEVSLLLSASATQAGSNDAAMTALESALWQLFGLLRDVGCIIGTASQPRQVTYGQAQALTIDIAVRLHVDDE